jgi:hypothetical protein
LPGFLSQVRWLADLLAAWQGSLRQYRCRPRLRASGSKNSPQCRHLHDPWGCIAAHPIETNVPAHDIAAVNPRLRFRGEEKPPTEEDSSLWNSGRRSTEEKVTSCPPESDEFLPGGYIWENGPIWR